MMNPMTIERDGPDCIVAGRIYHKHPRDGACSADKGCMQPLLLLVTLVSSVILSLTISRIFLGCVFHLMTHRTLPFVFYWRRVMFATALFWLWYLTPMIAASHAATRVIQLLIR
jgi:hypothetical protein